MADKIRSYTILQRARDAARLVIDVEQWLVYELPPLTFDRRAAASLVFESETVLRRVRDYPEDWRELSDADLFALSLST
jgi:hypothetical protein